MIRAKNQYIGLVNVVVEIICVETVLAVVLQSFHLFVYPLVLSANIVYFLFKIYLYRHNIPSFNFLKLKNCDWMLLVILAISIGCLYQVHYKYSGMVTDSNVNNNTEIKDLVYPYPYYADEWYAVAFIKNSIKSHRLPFDNPFFPQEANAPFPNLEFVSHSFLSGIMLLFRLDPVTDYTKMTIGFNTLIVLLIYFFLRYTNTPALTAGISALAALFITNGANLPGIGTLIPLTLGIIPLLLSLFYFEQKNVKMVLLTVFLGLVFYPPLVVIFTPAVIFFVLIHRKYWAEGPVKIFSKYILVVFGSTLIVSMVFLFIGSFQFQVSEFEGSLGKIKPLLVKLGQPTDRFIDIRGAVDWLNNISIEPYQNYVDHIKKRGIDEGIRKLLPADFLTFSNDDFKRLALTADGQKLKRAVLNQLYPQETPKRLFIHQGLRESIAFIISKFYYHYEKAIPDFNIWHVLPWPVIILAIFALFRFYKDRQYLRIMALTGLCYWFIYSMTIYRLIINYDRVVYVTSILLVILSGIGLHQCIKYCSKNSFIVRYRIFHYLQLLLFLLIIILSLHYTARQEWKKLTFHFLEPKGTLLPAAPANISLTPDDLRVFKNVHSASFLSSPWKGTAIGVVTDNYPRCTKPGTVTLNIGLYDVFVSAPCNYKQLIAYYEKVRYFYVPEFNCTNFIFKDKGADNLSLYEYVKS